MHIPCRMCIPSTSSFNEEEEELQMCKVLTVLCKKEAHLVINKLASPLPTDMSYHVILLGHKGSFKKGRNQGKSFVTN